MSRHEPPKPDAAWQRAAAQLDASEPPPSDDELGAMLRAVQGEIAVSDGGLGGWLRSRPTWMRRGLLLLALLPPALQTVVGGVRSNLGELSMTYVVVSCGLLATLAVACAWLSARPLQYVALPHASGLRSFAVVTMMLVAVALLGHHGEPLPTAALMGSMLKCTGFGIAMIVPFLVVAHLADRGSWTAPLFTVSAGALAANAWLVLECPISDATHCLTGHAAIALWLLLASRFVRHPA